MSQKPVASGEENSSGLHIGQGCTSPERALIWYGLNGWPWL